VYKRIQSYTGNVPIRLIATVLVAILIPSVLVTALGLVTVFQADTFVKDFVTDSFRVKLDEVAREVEPLWESRLQRLDDLTRDAHQRGRNLLRLREVPEIADLIYSDGEGFHGVRHDVARRELWGDIDSEKLMRARRLENDPVQTATALALFLELVRDADESIVVEALFGAARTSRRLARYSEALGHLKHALHRFGDTVDETGVLRNIPILLHTIELQVESDSDQALVTAGRLADTLSRESGWISSEAIGLYRERLEALVPGSSRLVESRRAELESARKEEARISKEVLAVARPALKKAAENLKVAGTSRIVQVEDGARSWTFYCARAGEEGFVVHALLDVDVFAEDLLGVLDKLRLPRSLVGAGRPGQPIAFGGRSDADDFAVAPLPTPLSSHELRYLPEPGEVPAGFYSFEVMTAATFSWAVALLVLMIIVGVFYTLRYVLRETKTARLKSDFVSFISHDINTPLAAIRMFTETLLADRVADDEERKTCLRLIERESDRLQGLIEKVMAYSKVERKQKVFQFASCSMVEVVEEAVRLFHDHTKGRPRNVELNSVQHVSNIQMDRAAMVEVVLNLLSNAAKYSSSKTKITVNLRETVDDITVEVIDRGIGIPRRDQKRIFEKFFRSADYLTREVEGTGLGLAFSRYIAKVHNGEIRVASQKNVGSVFTLQLRKTHVIAQE